MRLISPAIRRHTALGVTTRATPIRCSYRKPAFIALFALSLSAGCHSSQTENNMLDPQQRDHAITGLRAAYAAFNRGDIDSTVALFDPNVEWIEPAEFPGGGTYHGVDAAKRYLAQSRAGAAEVVSQPEQFLPAGNRIVVFVHARVLPHAGGAWHDVRLADVFTFQNGRVTHMRAFADRQDALRYAGIDAAGIDPSSK